MKTRIELNALRKELEALNEQLRELTAEELVQVTGGRKNQWRRGPANRKAGEHEGEYMIFCPICGKFLFYDYEYSEDSYNKHVNNCFLPVT